MHLRSSEDVVIVRQAVRKKAVALGCGLVDQTKCVTASSELARNTLDYGEMYRGFAGHDPDVRPMLQFYGLPVDAAGSATVAPPPVRVPAMAAPAPKKIGS